jgi:hypothetical protein
VSLVPAAPGRDSYDAYESALRPFTHPYRVARKRLRRLHFTARRTDRGRSIRRCPLRQNAPYPLSTFAGSVTGIQGPGPLVSLIMPVWQPRSEWLRAAVESALGQRRCRLELIVVDDGCPEPAASLLADIADERMRVIRIDHGGPAAARNAGIAEARGARIRFMDSDDVLDLNSTSHLASLMSGDTTIAYGKTVVCDERLQPCSVFSSTLQGRAAEACLLGGFSTRCPALLFPRWVVEAAGPWDPAFHVSGDWDFVLRALEHAPVVGDDHVAFYYRRHAHSISGTADIAAGEVTRRRLVLKFLERHPGQRGSRLERRAWAALYLDRAEAYWHVGHPRAAMARLGRALKADPLSSGPAVARFGLRATRSLMHRVRQSWRDGRREGSA